MARVKRAMILVSRQQRASEASYERCTAGMRPGEFAPCDAKKKSALTVRAQPIHVSSTGFPQRLLLAVAALCLLTATSAARTGFQDAGTIFRVFLTNGQALPSFGEAANVGDRLVFTLLVGPSVEQGTLQLVSLPLDVVDLDRTAAYAIAMRSARYAATRGESDYAAITAEVERSVSRLVDVKDPKERLRLAEEAKRKLLNWSRANYHYRSADIRKLAGLFDDVIVELRAATGDDRFSFELDAGAAPPPLEPLIAPPSAREALTLALVAAGMTDASGGRGSILTAIAKEAAKSEGLEDLADEAARRLRAERSIDDAYAALAKDVTARAARAVTRGDVRAMTALTSEVEARNRALGAVRPSDVASLQSWLAERLDAARRQRLALDHYTLVRQSLLDYELRIRTAMTAIDGLQPGLTDIRDQSGPSMDALVRAESRLQRLVAELAAITPPAPLADVHATLQSATYLAREAIVRRKTAVATLSLPTAQEASAAASGSLLLAAEARARLVERLFPPKAG